MTPRPSELLQDLISEERKARIETILERRTRFVTVVLDNLYHPHNMSAVVRSCEAFGIQDIHAIEKENRFDPSHGIAMGAQRWITLYRHPSARNCTEWLKKRGYTLLAADPPDKAAKTKTGNAFTLDQIPLEQGPVALVFGKELDGLDPELRNLCDAVVSIPMSGFTESLNVSVTAAICLYELRKRLDEMDRASWQLSREEKAILRDEWYIRSVKHGPKVLEELTKR
jgi:tRNA (guanosine-2'-O-)-methyltransferase